MHLISRFLNKALQIKSGWLFLFTAILVAISSLAIFQLEPETFGSRFNALWWVMTTLTTVGYGDFYPQTPSGKILAMVLYIFGIGLLGLVIGKIVEFFSGIKKRKEAGKLRYHGKRHFILIGWSDKVRQAIEELLASEQGEVVIIAQLAQTPFVHDRVHYVQGSPTNDDVLLQANLPQAQAVLLFSDGSETDADAADGKTLLTLISVERINPDVRTVAEILDERHVQNFTHAKVDEFILPHHTISRLAVRSAIHSGVNTLFQQLLRHNVGTDIVEVAAKEEWKTYRQAYEGFIHEGLILVSDREGHSILPKLDQPIKKNEKLLVIRHSEAQTK